MSESSATLICLYKKGDAYEFGICNMYNALFVDFLGASEHNLYACSSVCDGKYRLAYYPKHNKYSIGKICGGPGIHVITKITNTLVIRFLDFLNFFKNSFMGSLAPFRAKSIR